MKASEALEGVARLFLDTAPVVYYVEKHPRAAELRVRHNLTLPDALQIAIALNTGCDAFLTNDNALQRVTELRVLVVDQME